MKLIWYFKINKVLKSWEINIVDLKLSWDIETIDNIKLKYSATEEHANQNNKEVETRLSENYIIYTKGQFKIYFNNNVDYNIFKF